MSLSKSVEMRLTLWSAPVMQFLFHLVGSQISNVLVVSPVSIISYQSIITEFFQYLELQLTTLRCVNVPKITVNIA